MNLDEPAISNVVPTLDPVVESVADILPETAEWSVYIGSLKSLVKMIRDINKGIHVRLTEVERTSLLAYLESVIHEIRRERRGDGMSPPPSESKQDLPVDTIKRFIC